MKDNILNANIISAENIEKSDRELNDEANESEDDLLNLIAEIIVEIIIKKYRYGSDRIHKDK